MVHEPAVLAQAGGRHQRGQAVPLTGRGRHHRPPARPPAGLPRVQGDQPLADGARTVLLRDRDLPGRPAIPDAPQRRGDNKLAQVGDAHPGREPPSQCRAWVSSPAAIAAYS